MLLVEVAGLTAPPPHPPRPPSGVRRPQPSQGGLEKDEPNQETISGVRDNQRITHK